MAAAIAVALLGFGSDERGALAARLEAEPARRPAYRQVLNLDEARFVVADVDQPGVSDLLETLGRSGDAIAVGARRPARAAAWMPRPIDPVQVLQALDRLVILRRSVARPADEDPGAASSPSGVDAPEVVVAPDGGSAEPVHAAQAARETLGDLPTGAERRAEAAATRQRREAALRPVVLRHALLVDDSPVALAFLERHLRRYGITADRATTSGKAMHLLAQRAYGIVFLDIDLGEESELDGLSLCQAIKRPRADLGNPAPVTVLVSAFSDPVDRVRGRLAGADGHIGKPLDKDELDRLLSSHGLDVAGERPRSRSP